MNLYKSLSDDYRSYQLKESEKTEKSKRFIEKTPLLKESKRISSKDLKKASLKESANIAQRISERRKKLKEAVNINISSDDTNLNVAVDDDSNVTADVVTQSSVEEVVEIPEVTEEVIEEVPEEVSEEITEEVPEVVEEPEVDPVEPEEDDVELKESSEDNNAFWGKNYQVGDKVQSSGAGEVEILAINKDGNYVLVKRDTNYDPFVAAWCPSYDSDKDSIYWGQGHYFNSEDEAKKYFDEINSSDVEDSEELQECEVRSFRITRVSPSSGIYMIEADNSKNERSYIVGKNFNIKTNTLDEAEMFSDRSKANNKFKEMLVNSNRKGE